MKGKHHLNKRLLLIGASAMVVGLVAGNPVIAATLGEEMGKQSRLEGLEHQINVNERLLKLKEQELEFAQIKAEQQNGGSSSRGGQNPQQRRGQGNVQTEYFGQRPPQGQDGQKRRLNPDGTLAETVKTPEQIEREKALNLIHTASLREAFVPKSGGQMAGIVELDDRVVEVSKGSAIEGWVVKDVSLDRVVFQNDELGVTKTVFQAR
ncbi:hypothetical protein [Marinobacter salarius]|uniref:Type IV pilus biogenesis protein PilP n=1 Tax=Marinobacter salarius TaxID=1420917 RepID=A0A1W6KFU2_9GAMM|nr:hypothetical protein [Marinobacter salarius]ARM86296.1 hypothetical protein MARSALSMR5_04279 [Marinobacter salarius]